jgi:hypothetical protein
MDVKKYLIECYGREVNIPALYVGGMVKIWTWWLDIWTESFCCVPEVFQANTWTIP